MGKRTSLTIILLSLIFTFAFAIAYAEEMEYKEYKVLKGDTLWDISSKEFEQKDPFLWPKIWKENPEIKNPDRIYPGQTIKIPLKLLQKEQPEEAVTEKAAAIPEPAKVELKKEEPPKIVERKIESVRKSYIADKDLLISSGYITDYITSEVKSVGEINGSPSGRSLFGDNDYVYIKTKNSANTGDKFYIIRSDKFITHPKTNNKMGHLISVLGIAEVVGVDNGMTKAKITKSFSDVFTGDLLDAFYEVEPVMEEESPRKPDVSGFIVAIHQRRTISGYMDILFIDKGSNNGLEVGDIVKTTSIDKYTKSRTNGVIQIINLRNSTATAIVRKSESAIIVGDEISGLK